MTFYYYVIFYFNLFFNDTLYFVNCKSITGINNIDCYENDIRYQYYTLQMQYLWRIEYGGTK